MKRLRTLAALVVSAALPLAAQADVITLTFEGAGNGAQLLNFYNGGTDSSGHSGPNYGVAFGANALAVIDRDAGGDGNFANEPSPSTVLFFLSGSAVLNYAPGFSDGFSFYYTSSRVAAVNVYSGVNRTGTLLGTIALAAQSTGNGCAGDPQGGPGDPFGQFCNWTPVGVAFAGLARSIDFSGTVNRVGFDNITFGAAVPTAPVPDAGTAGLFVLGLLGLAGVVRREQGVRS